MKGFHAPESRKWNIWSRNLGLRSKKRECGVLSLRGIKRWRLRWKDTRLCFINTTHPDAFLAKIAPRRICRQAGDATEQVHLHPPYADSWWHLCPAPHLPQWVTIPELKVPKWSICWPDMRIHIHLVPVQNFPILMHLPRIASTIQILIQIRWLMEEHPLVCTLSIVW